MHIIPREKLASIYYALEIGLECARERLATHDGNFGRTIRRNSLAAERMEMDIAQIMANRDYVRNLLGEIVED